MKTTIHHRGVTLRYPGFMPGVHRFYKGFTLIEILVAIVIVGILAAIMLPQYQRAVLKSRYAALMPIAKSMADSNEAYFLEHGEYADNAEDLPVQGRRNYSDGTELEFGTSTDYAYVLASNPSVEHNTYIVYQKHSKNFADTTQCEALTADDLANQVCQSFGGTPLDGSLGGADYTAYLLSGNGNGTFEKECKGPQEKTEEDCECGSSTREVSCNTSTGQWSYGNWSGCIDKPQGSQSCSKNGKNGTQTLSATCTDGAWVESWGTCDIPCGSRPSNMEQTVTASQSGATGTATCVEGEWKYTWTNATEYNTDYDSRFHTADCQAGSSRPYQCAGATFSGKYSSCATSQRKGCADSTFSGQYSFCDGHYGYGCAGSEFNGRGSVCYGKTSKGCADVIISGTGASCDAEYASACSGAIISGEQASCRGLKANGCSGAILQAGAYCIPSVAGGCEGALYGTNPHYTGEAANVLGSCWDSSGDCPTGVPVASSWNSSNQAFDYTWKDNCCNPAYMASGVCPDGINVCE